jgi:hypothetical protein
MVKEHGAMALDSRLMVVPFLLCFQKTKQNKTRGASHFGLAIYIKEYLKAKEELGKLKYFSMQKI